MMKLFKPLLITLVLCTSSTKLLTAAATEALPAENSVIGTVDGKEVHLSDIETQKINELRLQLHDALQKAFIQHAVNQLTHGPANYKPVTPTEITDDQVQSFYLRNNLQSRGSLEQLSPMIKDYLEGMAKAKGDIEIYQRATSKGDITSRLIKPKEMLLKLPVESAFVRGNSKAGVMVMEFSDYQCPFCKRAQGTIKSLVKQYGDRVAFGYRHFPLAFHQQADDAALAVECARDQGGFEKMHEILFSQQNNLSTKALKEIAQRIELKDLNRFNNCLDKQTYANRVARDMAVGQSIGITGTPGFVIGYYNPSTGILKGELLSGAQPENVFINAIKKYLKGQ